MFNIERIKQDRSAVKEFGLKNMKELWQAQTKISNIRRNIRILLSGKSGQDETEKNIINRLTKLGVVKQGAVLGDLLDLDEKHFLERRLETVVFRKGLAKSMKQSRQLIVHGFISIKDRKVNKPGYIVNTNEEENIAYYKKIDINKNDDQNKKIVSNEKESNNANIINEESKVK